jgi:hypothetical protein
VNHRVKILTVPSLFTQFLSMVTAVILIYYCTVSVGSSLSDIFRLLLDVSHLQIHFALFVCLSCYTNLLCKYKYAEFKVCEMQYSSPYALKLINIFIDIYLY